jgi:hypothetical protein
MTMHLEGPWLSMTGKRRGKIKFRSSEEARKARELAAEWERKQAEWKAMSKPVTARGAKPVVPLARAVAPEQPRSLNSWVKGACAVKPNPQYTGTKIIGIGTMHKSNAVPIFTDEQAKDISTMRRG